MENLSVLEIILGLLLSVVSAVFGWYGIIRKAKADEAQVVLTAWKELLEPVQKELNLARQEIAALKLQLDEAEKRHRTQEQKLLRKIRELDSKHQ